MRRWALAIAGVLLLAGNSTVAEDAGEHRGINFQYAGPAGEVLPALERALGLGRVPGDEWYGVSEEEREKPNAIAAQGTRIYDLLRQVGEALGAWVDLESAWPHPRIRAQHGVVRGDPPRASTPNFDIVLRAVNRFGTRTVSWAGRDAVLHEGAPAYYLDLRIYPSDLDAAERFVNLEANRVVLRLPSGVERDIDAVPTWAAPEAPPLARCVRQQCGPVPEGVLTAGEHRITGAVLVARVRPVSVVAELPGDVGRTLSAGPVKFTVLSWQPGEARLRWVREGVADANWWDTDVRPTGVIWTEARAYGADGSLLVAPSSATYGEPGRMQCEMGFGPGQPARVEFRALVVEKEEDLEAEPFELTFTVPEAFLEK